MTEIRVRYTTVEVGDLDVHVRTLRDNQQFEDDGGEAESYGISSALWPIFGVLWASGRALARVMVDYPVDGLRVLEVGCGIGLASLVLNEQGCDITATDRHPRAQEFLNRNTQLNDADDIPFERTGWADEDDALGRFDLIIGSDLLYESTHPQLLADFIERHAEPTCRVILIDPGRGRAGRFTRHMAAHGYAYEHRRASVGDDPAAPYKGRVLEYSRTGGEVMKAG
jgi:predicted nicotinamide N-methyase